MAPLIAGTMPVQRNITRRGEPWATPQAAECLLGIRLTLVGGCSLAHGAAICARVYFLTHQYYVYDFTYEFYVRANSPLAAGRLPSGPGRPPVLSHKDKR